MLIDTSCIIEMLRHPKSSEDFRLIEEKIGEQQLYVLILQLAEVSDWCMVNSVSSKEAIENLKKLVSIVPLDEEICLEASRIKWDRRKKGYREFSLLDGLVLAAARSLVEKLLTFDRDFVDEKDCIVLESK